MSRPKKNKALFGPVAGFIVLALVNVLPLLWGVITSLKTPGDILTYPPKIVGFEVTLEHYERILQGDYVTALRNSALYAAASVIIGVVLACLAAFGFDRFEFRGKSVLFMFVVASIPLSIGAAALIVPNYIYFTFWGLTNKWYTLPIIYTAYNLPMAIWVLKGSMQAIPRELDEAAYIDGATPFILLTRIIFPLMKPALGAAAIFIFIGAWNEFVASSVLVTSPALRPVQVAIYQFIGFFGREWGPLTASATFAILPVIIVFAFLGRLFIAGLTQGSVKG